MDITKSTVTEFAAPAGNSTVDLQPPGTTDRAVEMLFDVISAVKADIQHGESVDPVDLLHKIIGLAHKHNLPAVREKALEG